MGSAVETNAPRTDPFGNEERFLLSRREIRCFLKALGSRTTLEVYDSARPIAYTRTTYFDTDDLLFFRSGERSPARRLRIREYAVASTPKQAPVFSGLAFIELKEHEGSARRKLRLVATPAEITRLIDGAGAEEFVRSSSIGSSASAGSSAKILGELALPTMAPRLGTWYRRRCFVADGGRVRITIDENLTFCRPQPIGQPGAPAAPDPRQAIVGTFPARVLEVKYSGEMPLWLGPAFAFLEPARSFSKFQLGMTALGHVFERSLADLSATGTPDQESSALDPFVAA